MITYRHQERFNVAKSRDYFRSPAGTHYNKFARKCLLKFRLKFQEAFTIQSDSVILNISAISGFFEVAEGGILFYRHSVADRPTVSVYHDYVDSLTESIGIDG